MCRTSPKKDTGYSISAQNREPRHRIQDPTYEYRKQTQNARYIINQTPNPGIRPRIQESDPEYRAQTQNTGLRPRIQELDPEYRSQTQNTETRPRIQEPDPEYRNQAQNTGARPRIQDPDPEYRSQTQNIGTRPRIQEPVSQYKSNSRLQTHNRGSKLVVQTAIYNVIGAQFESGGLHARYRDTGCGQGPLGMIPTTYTGRDGEKEPDLEYRILGRTRIQEPDPEHRHRTGTRLSVASKRLTLSGMLILVEQMAFPME